VREEAGGLWTWVRGITCSQRALENSLIAAFVIFGTFLLALVFATLLRLAVVDVVRGAGDDTDRADVVSFFCCSSARVGARDGGELTRVGSLSFVVLVVHPRRLSFVVLADRGDVA
jgi:hypothetical protein